MNTQPEALPLPLAWVNASNLSSAAISRQRGGPFDKYTWSEQRTDYHDTPLYAAAELLRLHALNAQLLEWACERWRAEVQHRPLINVHRRSLDDTWRQVIRYAGGDPDNLVGPSHDARLAAAKEQA